MNIAGTIEFEMQLSPSGEPKGTQLTIHHF